MMKETPMFQFLSLSFACYASMCDDILLFFGFLFSLSMCVHRHCAFPLMFVDICYALMTFIQHLRRNDMFCALCS